VSAKGWICSMAAGAVLASFAQNAALPTTDVPRFRVENEYKTHREYAAHIRQSARDAGVKKNSDRQTLTRCLSNLLATCPASNRYGDFGFSEVSVDNLALAMDVHPSAAARALRNCALGGALHRERRWVRDDRRDATRWEVYEGLEKQALDRGATAEQARRWATRGAGVRWTERSSLTVVFPRPARFAHDEGGLTYDDVIAIVHELRNQPHLIALACEVAERRKRDEAAGKPWTDEQHGEELTRAAEQRRQAADKKGGAAPSRKRKQRKRERADEDDGAQAEQELSPEDAASVATFAMVAEVFTAVRRDDTYRAYGDELVGELPPLKDQIKIGAFVNEQTRTLSALPCAQGLSEAEIAREFAVEFSRAYLRKEGSKKDGRTTPFLLDTRHPITWLVKDLGPCGELARRWWLKRRKRADEPQEREPTAPTRPRPPLPASAAVSSLPALPTQPKTPKDVPPGLGERAFEAAKARGLSDDQARSEAARAAMEALAAFDDASVASRAPP
jgi:hypothetical protein